MWILTFLKPKSEEGREVCLPATSVRTFTIGRKGTDLMFPQDPTVSREHAKLFTEAAASAVGGVPSAPEASLTDASTYGSAVNGAKLHTQTKAVHSGDVLRIGERQFRLDWRPVCLCCSRLDTDGKAFVNGIATKLGVHVTDTWSSQVTHLAMSRTSFTPKLLSALAYRVPVVVPHWLKALESALHKLGAPPDVRGGTFVPHPADSSPIVPATMEIKLERAALFAGRTFVFYAPPDAVAQQVETSALLVRACGGSAHVIRGDREAPAVQPGEAVGSVLHVRPASGVALGPTAAASFERAEGAGLCIPEEIVRTCLVSTSLAALLNELAKSAPAAHALPSPSQRVAELPLEGGMPPPTSAPSAPSADAPLGGSARKQPLSSAAQPSGPPAKRARAQQADASPAAGPAAQPAGTVRVVHLADRGHLSPGAGAQPQPEQADEEPAEQPRGPPPARTLAPGWRSKRVSDACNVTISRGGNDDGEAVDAEAARTAVVSLICRPAVAPTARTGTRNGARVGGKHFAKVPIRRVGQAYVPLVPDDPTVAEDEQEIRRELEEEERYSREADKLFKTVKDLPVGRRGGR
ncbi:hypothetical protein T492DRAFT_1040950 [Pavlovales sp. CCMP2436]|nr:hypothetical protein T492DRAFT_1040950 [Pavlovales sp. CCMP2436]